MANGVASLVLAGLISSCTWVRHAPPAPPPRAVYTLGTAYLAGGVWRYPAERFELTETGLASVIATHGTRTADGEAYDPRAMAGAHPTLQLPVIARITALATGRQILVRLNERGPADPARIVALTPRAASLLGIPAGGALAVALEVDGGMSRRLTDQLGGGQKLAIQSAPRESVTAESLPPPGAQPRATRGRARVIGPTADASSAEVVPDRLPEIVTQVTPAAATLYLRGSDFGRADYAREEAARLAGIGAEVLSEGAGRGTRYAVRAGPFATVAEADRALRQALDAGVADARLTAE